MINDIDKKVAESIGYTSCGGGYTFDSKLISKHTLPKFSTSIKASWSALMAMSELDYSWDLKRCHGLSKYRCRIEKSGLGFYASHSSAPMAVALAIIEARKGK